MFVVSSQNIVISEFITTNTTISLGILYVTCICIHTEINIIELVFRSEFFPADGAKLNPSDFFLSFVSD